MDHSTRDKLWQLIDFSKGPSWISELAGILPLSAVIDFIDGPKALHLLQLRGNVPLWCWLVTPSASRILFDTDPTLPGCCLDITKASNAPICLDGRFGDQYPMANAETIRMCLGATESCAIAIDERQKERIEAEANRRSQSLEIVTAVGTKPVTEPESGLELVLRLRQKRARWWVYHTLAIVGWGFWIGLLVFSVLFSCWCASVFLIDVVMTGLNVVDIFGGQPRMLGQRKEPSEYNRLVITANHLNASKWRAFYGRSDIINSLLNWPITPARHRHSKTLSRSLRLLVLTQWILAVAAAATKGWDAYLIAFWIVYCILSISYFFAAERHAKDWLTDQAHVEFKRHEVTLSSRRAMLNTLIAINPDTVLRPVGYLDNTLSSNETIRQACEAKANHSKGHSRFPSGTCAGFLRGDSLRWIDPILAKGEDRDAWEEATARALGCKADVVKMNEIGQVYKDPRKYWWWKFIVEGIEVAEHIQTQAGLAGHNVVCH